MRVAVVISLILVAASIAVAEEAVPPRDLRRSLAGLDDAELWAAIERADRRAVVGLRTPGRNRGIWKDQILIERAEVLALRGPLTALGLTVETFRRFPR